MAMLEIKDIEVYLDKDTNYKHYIKNGIEDYIKTTLPCPNYFDSIVSIEIDFDYNFEQLYKVKYKSTRFYDKDKNPWKGKPVSDDTYSIPIITELTINVASVNVCRSY